MKVNFEQEFTPPELDTLQSQLAEKKQQMSKQSKKALKKLKKLANQTQKQFKSNKQLYEVLASVQSKELQEITLLQKKIISLAPLKNKIFPKLTDIDLSTNSIQDISPLLSCQVPCITQLNLSQNKVSTIKGLQLCSWTRLKILNLRKFLVQQNLGYNKILSIQPLTHGQFISLQKLDASQNKINNLSGFYRISSRDIKVIYLKNNMFQQMKGFQRTYFKKLSQLNLKGNGIIDCQSLQKIQPTTIKNKCHANQQKSWNINVKSFISYSYSISYSQLIFKTDEDILCLFSQKQKKKNKNRLFSSKHYRLVAIDQYKKREQMLVILPSKKIYFG